MPLWLAQEFARAWDAKLFQKGLDNGPNDKDDFIRFECEDTDVYMRLLDNKLTLATPVATHFLHIEMNIDLVYIINLLFHMDIISQKNEYKCGGDVFFENTHQLRLPSWGWLDTVFKINWESTRIPEVPRRAFACNFELDEVDDRFPPAIFPELWS